MRIAKCILIVFMILYGMSVVGQTKSQMRDLFISAEGDILFEDYAEALPKYLNLMQIYPENYNFYFRVGQCYLNTPGEKDQSIPYLETAVKKINPGYRRGKFSETGAPYDALYFLANAYRINNELDKALESYALFMKEIDVEVYDSALVSFQIGTCYTAREMMKDPVYVVEQNLGEIINNRFSEFNPVISSDEKTLLFTRELQFYDAVFYSTKTGGSWAEPINLTPQLGIDQDYYTSSLTADGKTLLLYRTDRYDGNIYISRFGGGQWSNVEKLNENINTKYWESHATLSLDGRMLFFTSNRKESLGGLDIFVSLLDSTGTWGPAQNLGPTVNTIYNEESPFLTNNDRTLFFSSRGHNNMGGYDIFRSDLDDSGEWSTPVNIGYPVNTTDDDLFFMPVGNGERGYFSKFTADGYGKMDIFQYEIFSQQNPRTFVVTGTATIGRLKPEFLQSVEVTATNNADFGSAVSVLTDPVSGLYSMKLPQGSYTITFTSEDAATLSRIQEMPLNFQGDTVRLNPVTLETTDNSARLVVLADSSGRTTYSDPITFELLVEDNSVLRIELFSPDTLRHNERHMMNDTTFTFQMVPPRGRSLLVFNLADRFGNAATDTVHISDAKFTRTPDLKRTNESKGDRNPEVASPGRPVEPVQSEALPDTGTDLSDDENTPDRVADARYSPLWWLLALIAVIVLYLIGRSRKRKENDNVK